MVVAATGDVDDAVGQRPGLARRRPDPSRLQERRDEQEARRGALAETSATVRSASGEPAAGLGDVAMEHQDEPGPEGTPAGRPLVTESNVGLVGPLPGTPTRRRGR